MIPENGQSFWEVVRVVLCQLGDGMANVGHFISVLSVEAHDGTVQELEIWTGAPFLCFD